MRTRSSSLVLAAIVAALAAAAGCNGNSERSGAAATGDGAAGTCLRDPRETLLASLDRSCTLSSDCPHGAFCDVSVGGFCNFQCFDDSECPSGKMCDCFGRCVGNNPDGGDAGPAVDPACPRSAAVITASALGPTGSAPDGGARTCQFDDTCPHGTSCSIQTGRCSYDCLNDSQCPAVDGGARVCDCFGHCVAPGGAKPVLPTRPLSTVSLVPSVIAIPRPVGTPPVKPAFTMRKVQVRVDSAPGAVSANGQPLPVTINVTARRFIEVRCPKQVTTDPTPVFGKTCKLNTWSWTAQGDRFFAIQSIDVEPSAEAPFTGGDGGAPEVNAGVWNVDFQSGDVSDPAALAIQYSNQPAEIDPSLWPAKTVVQGGYRGIVRLTMTDESNATTPDGKPRTTVLQLAVTAIGDGGGLLNVYDPTHVLSTSGILALRTDSSALFEDYISNSFVGTGSMGALVSPSGPPLEEPTAKRLSGRFSSSLFARAPGPGSSATLQGNYLLTPDTTVLSCSTGTAPIITCPTGTTCSFGFCVAGPAHTAAPVGQSQTNPTFGHPALAAWANPTALTTIRQVLGGTTAVNPVERIVCQTNFDNTPAGSLDGPVDRFSGDVQCLTHNGQGAVITGEQSAIPLPFLNAVRVLYGSSSAALNAQLSGQEVLGKCLAELSLPPPPPAAGALFSVLGAQFFTDLPVQANPKRCFSGGNFYTALTLALDSQITGGDRPKLYQNLLRQWLELHSFMGREGVEELALDTVLASAQDSTDLSPNGLTYDGLLNVMEDGLWLILQQYAQAHVEKIAVADYVFPDYRPGGPFPTLEAKPEHEEPGGFVPALLEASAAYLKVVEANLHKVDVDTYETSLGTLATERVRALRRYGDALRITTAAQAFALQSYVNGATTCGTGAGCKPIWEKRWREALNLFLSQRSRTMELAAAVSLVRNPLGIDENDLPLFFGDPAGASSQFFASSDYLVEKWATPAIAETSADLTAARDAWIQARNSHVQDDLLAADRDRRLEDIGRLYGKPVIDNCGLQEYQGVAVEAKDVFDIVDGTPLNSANCFVDRSCAVDPVSATDATQVSTLFKQLPGLGGAAVVNYQLCIWKALAPQLTLPPDVQACIGNDPSTWNVLLTLTGIGSFSCNGVLFDAATLWRDYGQNSVLAADRARAAEACDAQFGHYELPVPAVDPLCYHGKLGEAMSRIVAAKQEVATALAHLETTEVSANEKSKQCTLLVTDSAERASAQSVLDQIRDNWAKTKDVARDVQRVTGVIQGAVNGAQQGYAIGGPVGAGVGAVLGGLSSFFGGGADAAAQQADDRLRLAEADYQTLVNRQDRAEQITACWGEFNVLKSQIDGDISAIKARGADANSAVIEFQNLLRETDQSLTEGGAAVKRETNRPFGGYAFHFWYDEKVQRFKRDFVWAQRLTYLAMRAVEYEFQQSLPLRQQILSAHNPDELDAAMLILSQERAGRTINRRRPEQSTLVVSMRDDVLKVADRSGITNAGERAYTPAVRFMGRLRHPQYAIYDQDGQYMGQGIVFPLDRLAADSSSGVALANRCAERLWRVTATVQGDGLSASDPGTTAFLLKRNTFSSQWCDGLGDGKLLQVAAVQPSRRLFSPDAASMPADQSQSFTAALLYPWFNIRKSEFFREAYTEGASEELAGRGLYGDYVLLFPKELLQSGFPLERVEDVLVRFDYLSVDNLPSAGN